MNQPQAQEQLFAWAVKLHKKGEIAGAIGSYQEFLRTAPQHAGALNLLGLAQFQAGSMLEAAASLTRAVALDPELPNADFNLGRVLHALGRHEEAAAHYRKALARKPDDAEALNNLATILKAEGKLEESIEQFQAALKADPNYLEAHLNLGNTLQALKRSEEALVHYQRCIEINPWFTDGHVYLGSLLTLLGRHEEALRRFQQALAQRPAEAGAHYRVGNSLRMLGRDEEATQHFRQAIARDSNFSQAFLNLGHSLQTMRRYQEAIACYRQVLALEPDSAEAEVHLGSALYASNRRAEALPHYERAVELNPDYGEAHYFLGNALQGVKEHERAAAHFERAVELMPNHKVAFSQMVGNALNNSDWSKFESMRDRLETFARDGSAVAQPLTLTHCSNNPELLLKAAQSDLRTRIPSNVRPGPPIAARRRDKIRIAYLSSDFRGHPGAVLMVELVELHDRERFEVIGVSFGADDKSELRARISAAFDQFHDVLNRSDREIADLLRQLEIDIAIDRNGHTQHSRPAIFAQRPAPIQVEFLGYPGTSGGDFMDYIIADPVVAPFDQQPFFSEKIVHLPDSYQANDRKRKIADAVPTRREERLPDDAFVFCCFNKSAKINPEVFDVWMRILRRVDGSVLWLLRSNEPAARNLAKEAEARGVDAERVIFATKIKHAEHLARHRLADLSLDTLPYNAHTTASDALWAGLPLITCRGATFAGRVGASLLRAAGLPELITENWREFEELAVGLAQDPARLAAVKQRLADNRMTCALFDSDRYRRHLEAAYTTMWETWQRGEQPRSFAVTPLP